MLAAKIILTVLGLCVLYAFLAVFIQVAHAQRLRDREDQRRDLLGDLPAVSSVAHPITHEGE